MAISGNTLHAGRFEQFLTIMRSPEGSSFPASSKSTIMRSPEGVNTHAITRRGVVSLASSQGTIMQSPEGASFRRRAAKYHHAITRRGVVSPASSQHTIMRSPEGVNTHAITRRGFGGGTRSPAGANTHAAYTQLGPFSAIACMPVGACEVPFSA